VDQWSHRFSRRIRTTSNSLAIDRFVNPIGQIWAALVAAPYKTDALCAPSLAVRTESYGLTRSAVFAPVGVLPSRNRHLFTMGWRPLTRLGLARLSRGAGQLFDGHKLAKSRCLTPNQPLSNADPSGIRTDAQEWVCDPR
jgi:hypothetical protein